MAEQIRRFHWWWAWSSDKFENWLERMHSEGWAVTRTESAHTTVTFTATTPEQVRYCVDYQNNPTEEYQSILADDGWRQVALSNGWYIWAKPYAGQRPDLFTDKQSLIDRNKRLLGPLVLVLMAQLPMVTTLPRLLSPAGSLLAGLLFGIYLPSIVLLAYCVLKIALQNRKLQL